MSTFGPDYDETLDGERIHKQHERIRDLMRDGKRRTLAEIAEATGYPEASISAQLRHLRKERFGSWNVLKERIEESGLWAYWIDGQRQSTTRVDTQPRELTDEEALRCGFPRMAAALLEEQLCGFESMVIETGPNFGKLLRCSLPKGHEGECEQDIPSGDIADTYEARRNAEKARHAKKAREAALAWESAGQPRCKTCGCPSQWVSPGVQYCSSEGSEGCLIAKQHFDRGKRVALESLLEQIVLNERTRKMCEVRCALVPDPARIAVALAKESEGG